MNLPTLSMIDWSITSFEVRYEYLAQMERAAHSIINQPRAMVDDELIPGAAGIEDDIDDIFRRQNEMLDVLRERRFDNDPDAEHRRIKLLMLHELTYPEPGLDGVLRIAMEAQRPAA